jgi:hypothetical protein
VALKFIVPPKKTEIPVLLWACNASPREEMGTVLNKRFALNNLITAKESSSTAFLRLNRIYTHVYFKLVDLQPKIGVINK